VADAAACCAAEPAKNYVCNLTAGQAVCETDEVACCDRDPAKYWCPHTLMCMAAADEKKCCPMTEKYCPTDEKCGAACSTDKNAFAPEGCKNSTGKTCTPNAPSPGKQTVAWTAGDLSGVSVVFEPNLIDYTATLTSDVTVKSAAGVVTVSKTSTDGVYATYAMTSAACADERTVVRVFLRVNEVCVTPTDENCANQIPT